MLCAVEPSYLTDTTLTREAATMTDTDFDDLEKECSLLRRENSELKETLNLIRLNKEVLDRADERVKFYTGLTSYLPQICDPNNCYLTLFQLTY